MTNNQIKAVIFDYGGVLSLNQDGELKKTLASMSGLGMEEFHRHYFGTRNDFDKGVVTAAQYWRSFFPLSGKKADEHTIAELIRIDHLSWARINGDLLNWALELKDHPYKISILSNMPHEFHWFFMNEYPWARFFEPSVYSCLAGYNKPEPEIFTLSLETLHVSPGQAVFFDDREDNVTAARQMGINAFRFKTVAQAKEDLFSVTGSR
jgi:putative hydrolase of the HAD superfamily